METMGLSTQERLQVWRSGDLLVAPVGATLPDRCVRCNAAAAKRVRRRFSWHTPIYYWLILTGFLPYLFVALLVSRRATFEVPLCADHFAKNQKLKLLVLPPLLLGGWMVYWGILHDAGALVILPGFAVLFLALVPALMANGIVKPKRIDRSHAWLKGASAPYLDSLPVGPSLL